ncbi:histamine N-methyltransferase-like [Amphiura filiformis]|uniref:histamine N-methyltransferase-like n=1 Tax=Amphiura filiformis TaxID=82378 RepID=UPI003B210298
MKSTTLQPLYADMELYKERHHYFYTKTNSREAIQVWTEKNVKLKVVNMLSKNLTNIIRMERPLRVLGVGSSEGDLEIQQLKKLLIEFSKLDACVCEPDKEMISHYRDTVNRRESVTSSVAFEWQNLTFQEYLKNVGKEKKYHFISLVHVIYFIGDPEEAIKNLYKMLEEGGMILLIVVTGDNGTLGSVPLSMHNSTAATSEEASITNYKTDSRQIKAILEKLEIAYTQSTLTEWIDVTLLVTDQVVMREASLLLDFLTLTINFKKTAPDDVFDQVIKYFKDNARAQREQDGREKFYLTNKCTVFLITK